MLQANIEAVLYKICNRLPHVLTDKCTNFVTSYSEKFALILARLSPRTVCIHLHLCDPSLKPNNIAEKDEEICELFLKVHI